MPLSEHEQRVLEQMERALTAEDPQLVSTLTGSQKLRQAKGGFALSAFMVVLGIVTLFGGLISKMTFVGVIGFALALIGIYLAIRRATTPKIAKPKKSAGSSRFIKRLEERWDNREDQ